MKNRKLLYIITIMVFTVSFLTYQYFKNNIRYDSDVEAINKKVTEVIHKEIFDQFTVYFYQPEDEPILVDYVYLDNEGYKLPSKTISKQAFTEHQVIWHYEEKNGDHLVVISKCLYDPTPFTISDNVNSTFKEISFPYEGFENTYYIATFSDVNDYKIYINNEEIVNWDKI